MKTEIELLKEEIQERLDKIELLSKPKFEVGKWYFAISGDIKWLICPLGGDSERINHFYGLSDYSGWKDTGVWGRVSDCEVFRPATDKEVEEALTKEAIKRGFKEGVRIDKIIASGLTQGHKAIEDCYGGLNYYSSTDSLDFTNYTIYEKGKWAEIIKDDVIKIGCYEVKFHPDKDVNTTIDGNIFTKEFWLSAANVSNHNKAKIMVVCSKQFDVSLEVINQILAKL